MHKKLTLPLLLLLSLLISPLVKAKYYPVVYQLKSYYSTSLTMHIEVNTSHLGRFVLQKSRSWVGDDRHTKNVFCAEDGRLISYGKPETCRLIFWQIEFYREPMTGLGSRANGDYYFNNNQWLLRESKNFPRFKGHSNAAVCINTGNCVALPAGDNLTGPLFLIWGKKPTIIQAAGLTFEVFTDKQSENIDKQDLLKQMEPSINYLNEVFIPQLGNRINKPIKMVMLAKDYDASRDSGGMVGDHAFLANYYVTEGKIINDWQASFIKLALHEYMHILTACNSFSRWACESLADYYAYKSLSIGNTNLTAINTWDLLQNTDPNYQLGLYKLDQKYQQTQRWNYYKLFYAKGASFWNELDLLLHQKQHNLDDFIQLLVINPNNYQTELPQAFIKKMIETVGEKDFNSLAKRYLY